MGAAGLSAGVGGRAAIPASEGEHQSTESHLRVRGLNGCTVHSLGAEAGRFPGGV